MPTYAHDIPGHAVGLHCADDYPPFYSAAEERFINQAGLERFNIGSMVKTAGAPAFVNCGPLNRRGLRLNGSNQWQFVDPLPWESTWAIIGVPHFQQAGTKTFSPLILSNSVSLSSNSYFYFQFFSGVRSFNFQTPSAVASRQIAGVANDAIGIWLFSHSQMDRKVRSSPDGATTVSAGPAIAGTTNGNGLATGSGVAGTDGAHLVRVGNNSGVIGDTAADANDWFDLLEVQKWRHADDGLCVMQKYPALLQAWYSSRRAYYGI